MNIDLRRLFEVSGSGSPVFRPEGTCPLSAASWNVGSKFTLEDARIPPLLGDDISTRQKGLGCRMNDNIRNMSGIAQKFVASAIGKALSHNRLPYDSPLRADLEARAELVGDHNPTVRILDESNRWVRLDTASMN
jgi:hypothetical protein